MKTYEEFRLEIMEQDFETPISHAKIEELAAKEYAKQWVLQTSEELNYTPRWEACVQSIIDKIDQQ